MKIKWLTTFLLLLSDAFCIYFSFWFSYEIRFFWEPFLRIFPVTKGIPLWNLYESALRTLVPLWILIFAFWGHLYFPRFLNAADEFLAVSQSVALATLTVVGITFLYRTYEYSRLVVALAFFLSIFSVFAARQCIKIIVKFISRKFAQPENVLLLAEGKICDTLLAQMKNIPHRNVAVYSKEHFSELQPMLIRNLKLQEVVVQGKYLEDSRVENFLEECEEQDIEIKILPEFLELRLGEVLIDDSLGVPILHLKPLSLHGFQFFVKRTFDVMVSILLVSLFFLPFLLIALLILIDSKGGIFFQQDRVGFKEKIFKCLKFRTMYVNAEQLLSQMQLQSFRGGPAFKMREDPRITRVGKFLRKWSLDELPQIWNVLKGEMSLIGPRPQVLSEAEGNPDWARKRYRILPGITGLWQVSGRADLTYEDMMRLDIYYLENWSPGLDLKILLKTLPVILSRKGAY